MVHSFRISVSIVSRLLASDATDIQLLATGVVRDPIHAGAVILLQSTNDILHLEFQTLPVPTPPLPLRILNYWLRLDRRYAFAPSAIHEQSYL